MSLQVPYGILVQFEDNFDSTLANAVLRLFSNNHTPVPADILADYTECTIGGYAPIALGAVPPAAGFSVDRASKTWPQKTFTFTAAGNVYGYYVTDAGNTKLLWAERYPFAPLATVNGLNYRITPVLSLKPF